MSAGRPVTLKPPTTTGSPDTAAWKTYRVLLNRVDTSVAPDIEWPVSPVME
ncbi:tail fiber assembly protein [Escherichia coli]|nr:tail fiber assembly protein [Escherichia fergusonii]MBZ2254247.1 tail fiber assembly protein [Escherichia coli]MBZ2258831.1 tail fiber assembly protein [Escherichia coli]MBZ2269045.1 tail fiber assembly protein [Escherichia coli]MBZ2273711.1 tail fiber assembly protein [Escherichia coli]